MQHAGGQNETSVEVLKLDASEFTQSNYDMTKSNLQTLRSEEMLGGQHRSKPKQYLSMLDNKQTPDTTEDVAVLSADGIQ